MEEIMSIIYFIVCAFQWILLNFTDYFFIEHLRATSSECPSLALHSQHSRDFKKTYNNTGKFYVTIWNLQIIRALVKKQRKKKKNPHFILVIKQDECLNTFYFQKMRLRITSKYQRSLICNNFFHLFFVNICIWIYTYMHAFNIISILKHFFATGNICIVESS